jgi:hypothetical protein
MPALTRLPRSSAVATVMFPPILAVGQGIHPCRRDCERLKGDGGLMITIIAMPLCRRVLVRKKKCDLSSRV